MSFNANNIANANLRPFTHKSVYVDKYLNSFIYQWNEFKDDRSNTVITLPGIASPKNFHSLASKYIVDLNCLPAGCQNIPYFNYLDNGEKVENISAWGLKQFEKQYGKKGVSRQSIFTFVYGVLHNPAYRIKYELNLKREFPRIPFYKNFQKWSAWGKTLMDLHINYETIEPYPLDHLITTYEVANAEAWASLSKPKLKADKLSNEIIIDGFNILKGIPPSAWEYKLGNRSALEWILDQYKESKPKDPTIAEKFNTYKFADYKDKVIDLLKRVCTVSVETMKIINEMKMTGDGERE